METKRNLSGIYFRSQNEETGEWGNTCFEDLSEKEQDNILMGRKREWLRSLVKQLAGTVNQIGDQFHIIIE